MHRYCRTLVLAVACCATAPAYSDSVATLPEYNGTGVFADPGPYQPPTVIGTFDIAPGDTSITISGSFGNSLSSSSSGVDLLLGPVLVAQCVQNTACYLGSFPPPAWSATLTPEQIAQLGVGLVDLTTVQTSETTIRLGETTLTQIGSASPVPEPQSLLLLGTGALGVLEPVRRRLALKAR